MNTLRRVDFMVEQVENQFMIGKLQHKHRKASVNSYIYSLCAHKNDISI